MYHAPKPREKESVREKLLQDLGVGWVIWGGSTKVWYSLDWVFSESEGSSLSISAHLTRGEGRAELEDSCNW